MTDSVNAGADEVKRENYGSKLGQWKAMKKSGCHVATSQRRDVPTSRRLNVATSPRRDVLASRRLNVGTSQRRDVATLRRQLEICTSSFKVPMAQKSGYGEAYEQGHGIPE